MQRVFILLKCILVLGCAIFYLSASAQDIPNVFVETDVDNQTPFVGQQVIYSFNLFDSIGLNTPLYEASDFEGFWRFDWGEVTQTVQQIGEKQYTVSTVKTALFPAASGTLTINSAKVILPETVFSSKQELAGDPLLLQVQPLPDGAPTGFSGAVGQFEMSATLSSLSTHVGEPVLVRLTVRGTGNVEQLQRPEIYLPPTWRIYDENPSYTATPENGQIVGTKVFIFSIFPNEAGSQTLPLMTLNYFDPVSRSYRLVSTAPMSLEVIPSEDSIVNSSSNDPHLSITSETVLSIRPFLSNNTSNVAQRPEYYLWLLPIGIMCTGIVWILGQTKVKEYQARKRSLNALESAREKLRVLQKSQEVGERSEKARKIVMEYMADKLGMVSDQLMSKEIDVYLLAKGISSLSRLQIAQIIDAINEEVYGPIEQSDPSTITKQVYESLRKADEKWKSV